MNKKKMGIIIFVCCIIIICVAAACTSIFVSNKNREENVKIQMGKFLTVSPHVYPEGTETSEDTDVGSDILKTILENVEYEIKKVNSDSCTLEIISPDIYKLYLDIMKKNTIEMFNSHEEYQTAVKTRMEQLAREIENGNYEFRNSTVQVTIKDGVIETTNEFADAIYGGLITLQEELIEKYIQEEK